MYRIGDGVLVLTAVLGLPAMALGQEGYLAMLATDKPKSLTKRCRMGR